MEEIAQRGLAVVYFSRLEKFSIQQATLHTPLLRLQPNLSSASLRLEREQD